MKMCNECYTVVKDSFEGECPIHRCYGDLVHIDDEIVEIISFLNRELRRNDIPLRTIFTCSGHFAHTDGEDGFSLPYIGFKLYIPGDDENVRSEYAECVFATLKRTLFSKPVDTLNTKLKELLGDRMGEDFKISTQTYVYDDGYTEHRIFVNDFYVDLEVENTLGNMRRCFSIQQIFREFLLDLIENIRDKE